MFHRIVLVRHLSNTRARKGTAFRLKSKVIILRWRQHCLKMTLAFNVAQVNFGVWKDLWEDNTGPIYTQLKCVFPFEFAPIPFLLPEGPVLNSESRVLGGIRVLLLQLRYEAFILAYPLPVCFLCGKTGLRFSGEVIHSNKKIKKQKL